MIILVISLIFLVNLVLVILQYENTISVNTTVEHPQQRYTTKHTTKTHLLVEVTDIAAVVDLALSVGIGALLLVEVREEIRLGVLLDLLDSK